MSYSKLGTVILLFLGVLFAGHPSLALSVDSIEVLREDGGRVDWSKDGNFLAYDRKGSDGYYDIYIKDFRTNFERCLTCVSRNNLPQKHIGNPEWHPSGDYLVFQAEMTYHPDDSNDSGENSSHPGAGKHNELWLAKADGSRFWRLTNNWWNVWSDNTGVLHPHFSPEGDRLIWTNMTDKGGYLSKPDSWLGYWELSVADFIIHPWWGPQIKNTASYTPGGKSFYETHAIRGDLLLFSGNFSGVSAIGNSKIALYNIKTDQLTVLHDRGYSEHAHFTHDNRHVIFMSNRDAKPGTEYYSINIENFESRTRYIWWKGYDLLRRPVTRMTYYNDPSSWMYLKDFSNQNAFYYVAADSAFSPNGKQMIAYIQTDLFAQIGITVLMDISE